MRFVALKKWEDGGESIIEYFATRAACERWIKLQPKSKANEWVWFVGEY